jgi:hypothetical protein
LVFNPEDGGDMFLKNAGFTSTELPSITSQKTELFTVTTLRTSNPINYGHFGKIISRST